MYQKTQIIRFKNAENIFVYDSFGTTSETKKKNKFRYNLLTII